MPHLFILSLSFSHLRLIREHHWFVRHLEKRDARLHVPRTIDRSVR